MRAALLLVVVFFAPSIVEVVPAKARMTKRVLFVVDVSGSMAGLKFDKASQAVIEIAGQPVDEMEIGLIAFDNAPSRWPGIPEKAQEGVPAVPKGWAALPSKEAVDSASGWLRKINPTGGTRLIPALKSALAEDRDKLSLVIVTDGQFYQETSTKIYAALEEGQKAREAKGLGRAVVLIYGVGESNSTLKKLGELGQGGFYRKQKEPVIPTPVMVMPQPAASKK